MKIEIILYTENWRKFCDFIKTLLNGRNSKENSFCDLQTIFPKTSNHLVAMKELLILHGKLLPLSDFFLSARMNLNFCERDFLSPWRNWTFYRGDKTEFLYWQSPRFFRLHVPIKQDFWIDQKDSPHLKYKEIKYHTISCHFQKLCH